MTWGPNQGDAEAANPANRYRQIGPGELVQANRGEQFEMQISARNQLTGTVRKVKSGSVMAEVVVSVDPGMITAAITDSSRERLGLKDGDQVSVIIKATEVMIATP
jgi:molybdopterin-binding protein